MEISIQENNADGSPGKKRPIQYVDFIDAFCQKVELESTTVHRVTRGLDPVGILTCHTGLIENSVRSMYYVLRGNGISPVSATGKIRSALLEAARCSIDGSEPRFADLLRSSGDGFKSTEQEAKEKAEEAINGRSGERD